LNRPFRGRLLEQTSLSRPRNCLAKERADTRGVARRSRGRRHSDIDGSRETERRSAERLDGWTATRISLALREKCLSRIVFSNDSSSRTTIRDEPKPSESRESREDISVPRDSLEHRASRSFLARSSFRHFVPITRAREIGKPLAITWPWSKRAFAASSTRRTIDLRRDRASASANVGERFPIPDHIPTLIRFDIVISFRSRSRAHMACKHLE